MIKNICEVGKDGKYKHLFLATCLNCKVDYIIVGKKKHFICELCLTKESKRMKRIIKKVKGE